MTDNKQEGNASSSVLDDNEPKVSTSEKTVNMYGRASSGLSVANVCYSFVFVGFPIAAVPLFAAGGNVATGKIASKNESDLADMKLLGKINDELVKETGKFKEHNKQLRDEVERLNKIVGGMEDTQNVLDAITKQQGQSIDEFEEQVEELKDQLRDLQVCFYTRYVKKIKIS